MPPGRCRAAPTFRATARDLGRTSVTRPAGTSIGAVGTTLSIADTPPHLVDADTVVIAVRKGPSGPQLGPGTKDVDEALGGTLPGTLAALGATGEAGEVTKIATGGRLAAPLLALNARYGARLRIRVSLDHYGAALHESERGARSFARTIDGLNWLARHGFAIAVAGRTLWDEG